jgi:hypothetical protein
LAAAKRKIEDAVRERRLSKGTEELVNGNNNTEKTLIEENERSDGIEILVFVAEKEPDIIKKPDKEPTLENGRDKEI